MIKRLALAVALILLLSLTAACASAPADGGRTVVCTAFPQYDWALNILGDRAADWRVVLLTDNGADIHSYEPSAGDIVTISTADVLIYVGGESDAWVTDALSGRTKEDMIIVSLLEGLGELAHTEETLPGMEHDDHEGHDDHDADYDEHVWLSLKNAETLTASIAEALSAADPDNGAVYAANAAAYAAELHALDGEYASAVTAAARNVLLFADRYPFRYMAEDYGLDCYAAFPGCSAETEASFETVAFLAERLRTEALPAVIVLEGSDRALANAVISAAGVEADIVEMNSLQSVTRADIDAGATYLSLMRADLEALMTALY